MRYAEPLAWMAKKVGRFPNTLFIILMKMAVSDLWVQLLVHKLVQCQAVFANEQTANFFIRRIFMANLKVIILNQTNFRHNISHRQPIPGTFNGMSIFIMEIGNIKTSIIIIRFSSKIDLFLIII